MMILSQPNNTICKIEVEQYPPDTQTQMTVRITFNRIKMVLRNFYDFGEIFKDYIVTNSEDKRLMSFNWSTADDITKENYKRNIGWCRLIDITSLADKDGNTDYIPEELKQKVIGLIEDIIPATINYDTSDDELSDENPVIQHSTISTFKTIPELMSIIKMLCTFEQVHIGAIGAELLKIDEIAPMYYPYIEMLLRYCYCDISAICTFKNIDEVDNFITHLNENSKLGFLSEHADDDHWKEFISTFVDKALAVFDISSEAIDEVDDEHEDIASGDNI